MKSSRRQFLSTAALAGVASVMMTEGNGDNLGMDNENTQGRTDKLVPLAREKFGGLGYFYILHMVSACPKVGKYHEVKLVKSRDDNGTILPVERKTQPFFNLKEVVDVPAGPGLIH